MFDDWEVTQYDPKTQCCSTRLGVNPKNGNWSYAACEESRDPKPGHKATPNGCGTKSFKVSDTWPTKGKCGGARADWLKACNRHDICYGTCQRTKEECDSRFCGALDAACDAAFPKSRTCRQRCKGEAADYCAGVKLAGGEAYKRAQKEACLCC
jgi:Group XII secretory phospholipase A2 precursor (PLA2G12)